MLGRNERLKALQSCDAVGLCDLPGIKVRAAEIADFAGPDQVVSSSQLFLDGCVRIGAVELVEIDVVEIEPFQAVLARFDDVFS